MEMATYEKYNKEPSVFLQWYYKRFVSCKDALPNTAHEILANKNVKVITQNIDNLHIKANHSKENLVEISLLMVETILKTLYWRFLILGLPRCWRLWCSLSC